MRFDGLDLNLLVALDILLTEQNITKASEKLFLSQPATSAALSRLRDYFEDELLIQVGRSMKRTPMGEHLAIPVKNLLIQTRTILNNKNKFDPLTAERTFRIMATDYTGTILLPHLNQQLFQKAPFCSIEQLNATADAEKQIHKGTVDILLLPKMNLLDEHPSEDVFHDEFVCVMWAKNPLSAKEFTLNDYKNAKHVVTRFGNYNTPMFDHWLVRNLDFERKIGYTAVNFTNVPFYLIGTPYIATMHKKLALQCAEYLPLHICNLPWETPKITMSMQWNNYQANDSGLIWFRQLICETANMIFK
ncbi:LysR family transcriptional regulator [Acinetobacter gerneri]|uniref:LysR family transcriptional regulator n=1 Tax=Acinetobacter gerneri TaxID=202952 RepID=UPI003A8B0D24